MKSVRRFSRLLPALVYATIGAATIADPALAQKQGGTLTVGLGGDITGFDPLKVGVFGVAGSTPGAALFDTMTTLDDKGNALPKLALSWTHTDDFKIWTLKLRPDVKFQDGTPFNAAAVKANFDRWKDPANKCQCAFYIANIHDVQVVDELTVIYNLNDPAVNFAANISPSGSVTVYQSPTAWQSKGDEYSRNPVGTGPYILKSWTAGDRMVLERNPNYWDKEHVYLDRIVLKPLPDAQSRFAALQAGEIDVMWDDIYDGDSIKKAQADKKFVVSTYTGAGANVWVYNTKQAPFDDIRVRQALVMALDRAQMSEALTGGLARPATNPYGDGSWVKCKDDGALPFDVGKARSLIKDYGKPVSFKMIVTATPRGRAVGQVMQEFWKVIGADMEIEQVDETTIVPRAFRRQFQLTPWLIVDGADPNPQMFANFHTGSPSNLAQFSDPEIDRLLEHARSIADQDKRSDDYCEISRIINHQATWFWTFQSTYYHIAKSKVHGVATMRSGILDVSRAWIE